MDAESKRFNINVKIAEQKILISIPRSREELYRKAERLINEKIGYFQTNYPDHNVEKNMALTLIDAYTRILQLEDRNDTAPYRHAMEVLTAEIESVVNESR